MRLFRGNPSKGVRPDDTSLSWCADPRGFRPLGSREYGSVVNCPVDVVRSTLKEPGRRIGQRGDATRAPSQGPRPEGAARCRSPAVRDWPQSDKSIHSLCCNRLARQPTFYLPLSPGQSRFAVAPARQSCPAVCPGNSRRRRSPKPQAWMSAALRLIFIRGGSSVESPTRLQMRPNNRRGLNS